MLAGLLSIGVTVAHLLAGASPSAVWILAIVLAHLRVLRHLGTLPVVGSVVLAIATSGVSMLVSGLFLNRLVASRYLAAGWRIRHSDGDLGEYSSRFLAEHELGLRENEVARFHADGLVMSRHSHGVVHAMSRLD